MGKKFKKPQPAPIKKGHAKQKIAKPQGESKTKVHPSLPAKPKTTNLFQIMPEQDNFAALGHNEFDEDIEYHEEEEGPEEFGGE